MLLLQIIPSEAVSAQEFIIIYPVLHPFFSATSRGAREEVTRYPGASLDITAPVNQSSEDQVALLRSYIDKGVDGIAIGPADDNLTSTINEAVAGGIPVICIDTDAPESQRSAYIGTDNYDAGYRMGRLVSESLEGEGRILISVSNLRTRNMIRRVEGFRDAVEDEQYISIVAIEEGMAESDRIFSNIKKHISSGDFNIIVTMDAESGPMVVRMWKAWGLDYPVFCFDDPDLVLEGIRDGIVRAAVVQNQFDWGKEAVSALWSLSKGDSIPSFINTGFRIITRDTLDTIE